MKPSQLFRGRSPAPFPRTSRVHFQPLFSCQSATEAFFFLLPAVQGLQHGPRLALAPPRIAAI